jgi:LysM repeat protein
MSGCKAQQNKSSNIQTIAGKKYYVHMIEKKQSLYSISKLYNISIEELYAVNPELKNGAKFGQEIKIPFAPATTATATTTSVQIDTNKYLTHKVAKGETMYSLSKKFSLSEKQLLAYNPALSQGIKEGQVIIVGEKKKGRNKDNKPPVPDYAVKEDPAIALFDSTRFQNVTKPRKNSYQVALLLPFKLDESESLDPTALARNKTPFPVVRALAVDFYLGFKKALDSLSAPDFSLNLQLLDVDESDSLRVAQFTNGPQFTSTDLVFGPLYANGFKTISKRSAEAHVPVISPITQQNKILYNNINVSKTNPSQYTLLESLSDYCMDSLLHTGANLMVVALNEKDKRETQYISAIRSYFNGKQAAAMRPLSDTLKIVKGINGIKASFKPGVKNIAVVLSTSEVSITDFVTQLSIFANDKDFTLCGWQNVTEMDNIDQEYLNQLHYTFPHQFNLINTAAYAPVAGYYKNLQDVSPSEYFYIGFDVAYYYFHNLKIHGPDFVYRLDELPMETNYMRFKYYRPDTVTGFDNRGVYIFSYKEYQLRKTGWK